MPGPTPCSPSARPGIAAASAPAASDGGRRIPRCRPTGPPGTTRRTRRRVAPRPPPTPPPISPSTISVVGRRPGPPPGPQRRHVGARRAARASSPPTAGVQAAIDLLAADTDGRPGPAAAGRRTPGVRCRPAASRRAGACTPPAMTPWRRTSTATAPRAGCMMTPHRRRSRSTWTAAPTKPRPSRRWRRAHLLGPTLIAVVRQLAATCRPARRAGAPPARPTGSPWTRRARRPAWARRGRRSLDRLRPRRTGDVHPPRRRTLRAPATTADASRAWMAAATSWAGPPSTTSTTT